MYGVKFTKDEMRAVANEAFLFHQVRVIPKGVKAASKQGQALLQIGVKVAATVVAHVIEKAVA